jgi:septum formation protein
MKLVLGSGSPRRKALLEASGLHFQVMESGVNEARNPGEPVHDYVHRIACDKAISVSGRTPAALVLAADTVVECHGEILVKPEDIDDAHRMLRMLSGRTHTVLTAYALANAGDVLESAVVTSRVTFRELSDAEIDGYVATGEPFDKAGAYGIQGRGGEFISHVEGSRDNVMGLPTREVMAALTRYGIRPES